MTTWLVAALAAAASALTFSPFGLWWLVPVAPACIAWLAERPTRAAPWALWACSLVTWLWWERWIMDVSVAGYVPLALYGSAYTPLIWWVAARLRRQHPTLPLAIVTALALVTVEWLRGVVVMHGYPWYLAGTPLVEFTALAQAADIIGPSWGTLVAAIVGGAAIDCALRRDRRTAAVVATVVVVACFYGMQQFKTPGALRVMLVQTNLPTSNKLAWSREHQVDDFSEFCRQTISGAADQIEADPALDLAVWPETMLPGFGLEVETLATLESGPYWPGRYFADGIAALQQEIRCPLLVGSGSYLGLRTVGEVWEWDKHFNSAYLVRGGQPPQRADKSFLTPFGETMPYISSWKWLEQRMLDFGAAGMRFDLDSGAGPVQFSVEPPHFGPFRFATPICFEDTVPAVCRSLAYPGGVKSVDALINLSNDGWFGLDDDGRADHELLARWRCIELRVPMARCANTGCSSFISSRGAVLWRAEPRQATTLTGALHRDHCRSIYGRIGDVLSPTIALAAAVLCFCRRG